MIAHDVSVKLKNGAPGMTGGDSDFLEGPFQA